MAQIRADEISRLLREEIDNYERAVNVAETGSVISVGDGIARVYGLENVMAGELIEFKGGVSGIALNLEEDQVGAVLLGEFAGIKEGDEVRRTGRKARLHFTTDPSLLAGLVAKVGSTVYDGSARGQLERLKVRLGSQ